MQRNNPVPPLIQAWCELEQYVGQGVIWCVMDCITYPESLFIGPKFALYSKKYSDGNSDYWTTDCRCMGNLCCVCIENGFPLDQKLSHK
mgnify:CR=1 FL=1